MSKNNNNLKTLPKLEFLGIRLFCRFFRDELTIDSLKSIYRLLVLKKDYFFTKIQKAYHFTDIPLLDAQIQIYKETIDNFLHKILRSLRLIRQHVEFSYSRKSQAQKIQSADNVFWNMFAFTILDRKWYRIHLTDILKKNFTIPKYETLH